jgi:hypothetical protein
MTGTIVEFASFTATELFSVTEFFSLFYLHCADSLVLITPFAPIYPPVSHGFTRAGYTS